MFLGKPKAYIYHMCYLRCRKGGIKVSWTAKDFQGSLARAALFSTDFPAHPPGTCSLGKGISTRHGTYLFACSFLGGRVPARKDVGCSYFISEMCRAEIPAFFLEYLKANYMRALLRPAPGGISFERSCLKRNLMEPYVT